MGRRKDQAQFNMRLDKPLLKQLQNAAKDQDRSVNSEMLHRLEQSFTRDSIRDRLTAIAGKIDQLLERRHDAGARDDLEQYVMRLAPGERDRLRTALDRALSRDADAMRRAEESWAKSAEPELPPAPGRQPSPGFEAPIRQVIEGATSAESRRTLYERARAAFVEQMRGSEPPMSEAEIARQRMALEDAIRKVEAEAVSKARTGARRTFDETDERWRANLLATAEGYRRNAKRHEARGAHEKAAEALETANKVERDAEALSANVAPGPEPELPMPQRSQAKGGKS